MSQRSQMVRILSHGGRAVSVVLLALSMTSGAGGRLAGQAHQPDVLQRLYRFDRIDGPVQTHVRSVAVRSGTRVAGLAFTADLHSGGVRERLYARDLIHTPPVVRGRMPAASTCRSAVRRRWNSGPHQAHVRDRLYSRDLILPGLSGLALAPVERCGWRVE